MDVTWGHFLAFTLGVCTWLPATLWEGRRIARDHPEEPDHMPTPLDDLQEQPGPSRSRWQPSRITTILGALVVSSLVLVGFGVQQSAYQADRDRRDACYERWGKDLTDTVTTRTDATSVLDEVRVAYDEARDARDNAVDSVVLVVIGLRADPPRAQDTDLDAVLSEFAVARARKAQARRALDRATRSLEVTRKDNPYPLLDCRR